MKASSFLMGVLVASIVAIAAIALQNRPTLAEDPAPVACSVGPGEETSAAYLQRKARCIHDDLEDEMTKKRLALVDDIYIKSWSYSLLNKVFFWVSVGLAVLVLLYPGLGPMFKYDPTNSSYANATPNWFQRAITTSAVQTSVTALAAFSFAFYAHYKDKQSVSETLMREVIFAQTFDDAALQDILERIKQMDKGFGFSTNATGTLVE
ncbi:hypothetical protein [uncultured Tateyamaria sp.]|uniref:hypothetical protein n=1 Tax=uncultured Tateyamaria sp. TaxID=455651 RepID=UPI00262460DF|nr:hypothetical protein [uncultured Tateyamaria sp.]